MSHQQVVQTAGLALNTRVEGEGPPLLYLGGSNFDLSIQALVFDSELTSHFTVAAADPRGLGNSDLPAGPWSMQDYAQDAVNLLDALNWNSAFVLGESFGAMVAMELAIVAPGRIRKLGLAAGAPGGQGGSSYPIHELMSITEPRARAIKSLNIQDSRFSSLLDRDPTQAHDRITHRVNTDTLFLNHSRNAEGYLRLLATRAEHDCWDQLSRIDAETLVIAGRFDEQAPLDRAERIQQKISKAELAVFESGHNVLFATTDPVEKIISTWCGITL